MLKLYEKTLYARNYKPTTAVKLIQILRRFIKEAQIFKPEEITIKTIEDYLCVLKETGRSSKTLGNHKSAISGYCDFLNARGILASNPAKFIKTLKSDETLPDFLPDNEVELLLDLARYEKIYCEVVVALNTGLRMAELQRLEWRDIDLSNKQLVVRISKGKRPRTVPLNQNVVKVLTAQKKKYGLMTWVFPGGKGGCQGRNVWSLNKMRSYKWWLRLSLDPIRDKIPTIANIPKGRVGIGWHIMRHTFATRLARAGVDILKIQDWLGHQRLDTTMRYIHLARNYDSDIELIV